MGRFFVTGAAGFIGRSLCQHLVTQGHQVIGLDAFITASSQEGQASLNQLCTTGQFKLLTTNLLSEEYLRDLVGVDLVFHLAGLPGVRQSWEQESDYITNNLEASQNLLRLCRQVGIQKMIFTSSSAVYGNQKTLPLKETMLCAPISAYARSKYATEQWLKQVAQTHKHQIITLRPFSVYGPGQRPDMAFRIFFEALNKHKEFPVHDPHLMKRDFTYLSDVIQGLMLASTFLLNHREEHYYTELNLGSGNCISMAEVIELFKQIHPTDIKVKSVSRHANEVISTLADLNKAQRVINYSPHVNLKTGLQNYWQWFQSNQEENACLMN